MATKLITPKAILSYPHLATPQEADQPGKKAKYSASLVFAPGTDLTPLRAAALEAATEKFGKTYKVGPKGSQTEVPIKEALEKGLLRSPFRTDVEKKGYAPGSTFINVRTEQKPQVVYAHAGEDGKPVPMPAEKIAEEMYPGAIVRGSITAFGYDQAGNQGVSFALNNLQKLAEGERLDGRVNATEEFDAQLGQAPADLEALT
jgi:hypothetical protein